MFLDDIIIQILNFRDTNTFGTKDKIFLFKEFWYLLQGWVSLLESAEIIAGSTTNFALKTICGQFVANLKAGETLAKTLSRLPKYFNEWDVSIIRSGEGSWELAKVMLYLAWEYEYLDNIKSKYTGAMIYPAILILVSLGAVYLLFVSILPSVLGIMQQFDQIAIPWTTQVMLSLSKFFTSHTYKILFGTIVIVFVLVTIASSQQWQKYFFNLLLRIPIIGELTQYYFLIKFFRYMKLMLSSGLNYVDTMWFLKNIVWLVAYTEMIDQILINIKSGGTVYSVLVQYPMLIPTNLAVLFKVWEQTGSVTQAIDNGITMYQQDLNKNLDNLSKIIEPVLVILVWGIIAMIAMSVFGIIGAILDSVQTF
jgi:type II secretory pathway component PulF